MMTLCYDCRLETISVLRDLEMFFYHTSVQSKNDIEKFICKLKEKRLDIFLLNLIVLISV
ncbi:hypothetical protein HERIO_340 [Hepatospora eriocheir]|uniref:Uncharacterized protein n=1 Tax=Hepatospora eriocheir TaxID=1081669 RepID=A0A1X0QDE8_9MICR|nr:hypothetical protein HERIO_340 [Hepatospora eriocheir]